MSCDQLKRKILLYHELLERDRISVDNHMRQCKQCASFFEQFLQRQAMIKEASSWKEEPADPELLTVKIMNAIGQDSQHGISMIDLILNKFNLTPVRYALTSLSVAMITFFLFEFNQDGVKQKNDDIVIAGTSIVLNSSRPIQKLRLKKNRPQTLSLYDCLKQCRYTINNGSCDDCKIRFIKLIRNYEDG